MGESAEPGEVGEGSGPRRPRCRRARRIAILPITLLLVLVGATQGRRIAYPIRVHLAERAIAAGRLDEAVGRLELLIREQPWATRPQFLRARAARELGRITEAEEILQRAVELGFPVDQARREHALLRAGAVTDGQEATLRRSLELPPDDEGEEVRRVWSEGPARIDR